MKKWRLNKFLAEQGQCSRRKADEYIAQGRVLVNGQVAELGTQITEQDRVEFEGRLLKLQDFPEKILLLFHKPRGWVCTHDPKEPDRIFKRIKEFKDFPLKNLNYAGRLDKDSEGLMLLSNWGEFIHYVSKGAHAHEKEYELELASALNSKELQRFSKGLDIGDKYPTKACQIKEISAKRYRVILTEGRNRQIRRMFGVLNKEVLSLKRVRVMEWCLADLAPGAWKKVENIEKIKV